MIGLRPYTPVFPKNHWASGPLSFATATATSDFPSLKFVMTPWGLGANGEANVVSIETGANSTYPSGRAGFNTLYCPVMGEGQGDRPAPNNPATPENPSWCAFPALYATDPAQDVPVTSAEATSRSLPQDLVRPTQELLATRPKMRGWVEIDVVGAASWVSQMASDYDNWIEKFITPISPGNDPTQYNGVVLINWERLKAFTFDFNRIGTSGDASWICYRQWRQLQTGGTGTLASPWTSVTGGSETEQQSRERLRALVLDFMGEVASLIRSKIPKVHLAWWNEPSPQNWYQLDGDEEIVWNSGPIATIDGIPMTRAEAIRYETLGWMLAIYALFDSIHIQLYDFLPPASVSGASQLYGAGTNWTTERPGLDVNVTHTTITEKTRLSNLYPALMEQVRVATGKPLVAWMASVSYGPETTGYRALPTDLQIYLDIAAQYSPNWSLGVWIDCLHYPWSNEALDNLTETERFREVLRGLEYLNPLLAVATGDPGNGSLPVPPPALRIGYLPPLSGPTYSGL